MQEEVENRAVMDAGGKEMETNEVENPIRKVDIAVLMRAYNTIRTGDNGRMLAAGIIMAMAAAGIGAVLAVGRKKNG